MSTTAPFAPVRGAYLAEPLESRLLLSAPGTNWRPILIDEFDGSTLDTSKWQLYLPWSNSVSGDNRYHDTGGGSFANGNYISYMMPDDVNVGGGTLKLTTQQRNVTAPSGQVFNYTEGMITSNASFWSQYGHFEIRAKMPTGVGSGQWPAFWTLSNGWPPESDIAEWWSGSNRFHQGTAYSDNGTHWDDYNSTTFNVAGFRTYAMEWGPTYQKYYMDGQLQHTVSDAHSPDVSMYILLNSGVSRSPGPNGSSTWPGTFEVDYVRVYGYNATAGAAIANGDFEAPSGGGFAPYGGASIGTAAGALGVRSGNRVLRSAGTGGAEQIISGLAPNTTYTFSGWSYTDTSGAPGYVGVKDYDGTAPQIVAAVNSTAAWSRGAVTFTTGAASTRATLFFYKPDAAGAAYFDDAELVIAPTLPALPDRTTLQNVSAAIAVPVLNAPAASGAFALAASSNNQSVVTDNGLSFRGTGSTRTLNVSPVANATGSTTITVTLTDPFGTLVTAAFVLTVAQATSIAGDQSAAGQADEFRLVRAGDQVQVFRNNSGSTPDFAFDYATAPPLVIAGLGGDDRLSVDYSGGDPVPAAGLFWDGGDQAGAGDLLITIGSSADDDLTLNADGLALLGGTPLAISGTERVTIDLGGGNNTLHAPAPANPSATAVVLNVPVGSTLTLAAASGLPANTDAAVSGTLILGANLSLDAISGTGSIATGAGGSTLSIGAAGSSFTFAGSINGAGGLTKIGSGTVTLSGSSSYSGATNVNAGALVVADSAALGSAAGGTTIATNASLQLQGGITIADAITFSGAAGTGDVRMRNLGGNNTIGGAISLVLGGSTYVIQTSAGQLTIAGSISSTGSGARTLYLSGGGSGVISGAIGNVAGSTLNVTKNDSGTWTLSGNNSFGGVTTINAGALRIAHPNALGSTAPAANTFIPGNSQTGRLELSGGFTFAPETLAINARTPGSNTTVAVLNFSGNNVWTGPINLQTGGQDYRFQSNAGLLSISGAITNITATSSPRDVYLLGAGSGRISGVISNNASSTGPLSVFVTGPGTWTLAGANTHFGGTNVSGGTLRITSPNAAGAGPLTIGSAASVVVEPGLPAAVKIAALNLASPATFDLADNDLVVGAATPPAVIQSLIVSARSGGTWSGPGLRSSAAAADPLHVTTLGLLSGAEYDSVGGAGTFAGQSYAASDTLVKYTRYGDTDFNGVVNFDDYVRTDDGFNNHRSGWLNGDFDLNGVVNFDDYVLIDLAFNAN